MKYPSCVVCLLILFLVSCDKQEADVQHVDPNAAVKAELAKLRKEKNNLNALIEESLLQINVLEKKRLLAERAEQIRIKADEIELNKIYDHKLQTIRKKQLATWANYKDRTLDTLKSLEGKEYKKVSIIKLDEEGMQFQHNNGIGSIPLNELPDKIQRNCIHQFESEIATLKKLIQIETEERQQIRKNAKLEAEKEFSSK